MDNFDLKKYLAEGRLLKEDSEDIAEMAYERDSVEDIVKRIKPILANHPQLKKQEDPEQYLSLIHISEPTRPY